MSFLCLNITDPYCSAIFPFLNLDLIPQWSELLLQFCTQVLKCENPQSLFEAPKSHMQLFRWALPGRILTSLPLHKAHLSLHLLFYFQPSYICHIIRAEHPRCFPGGQGPPRKEQDNWVKYWRLFGVQEAVSARRPPAGMLQCSTGHSTDFVQPAVGDLGRLCKQAMTNMLTWVRILTAQHSKASTSFWSFLVL